MALIDEFLPAWQFRERHERVVRADARRIAEELPRVSLADSAVIGWLFALRALPARLRHGADAAAALAPGPLGEFFDRAFVRLRDAGERGLVIGAVGEFWRAAGGIRSVAPAEFARDRTPGCARLAWAFEFVPLDATRTRVVTETRVGCNDAAALRRMRLYWWLIRPASGFIRRETLRLLAQRCETVRAPLER
jgi:hypothetical protein